MIISLAQFYHFLEFYKAFFLFYFQTFNSKPPKSFQSLSLIVIYLLLLTSTLGDVHVCVCLRMSLNFILVSFSEEQVKYSYYYLFIYLFFLTSSNLFVIGQCIWASKIFKIQDLLCTIHKDF